MVWQQLPLCFSGKDHAPALLVQKVTDADQTPGSLHGLLQARRCTLRAAAHPLPPASRPSTSDTGRAL